MSDGANRRQGEWGHRGAAWATKIGLLLDNLIDTDQLPQLCGLACDFRLQSFDEPVSFS
jgi:hypothetical protein